MGRGSPARWFVPAFVVLAPTHPAWGQTSAPGAEELDLEDVFGFTQGTDLKQPGELTAEFGFEARFGKGEGRFGAAAPVAALNYGLAERVELGFSLLGAGYDLGAMPDVADRSRFVFDGLQGEAKLELLDRGENGPVGVSLLGDLTWTRTDGAEGTSSDALAGTVDVLADAHLVPDTLFAAVNLGLDAERDLAAGTATSTAFASLAASLRLGRSTALGIDTRLEAAFEGVLEDRTGTAAFAGPAFYSELTDRISLQAGWLAQLGGSGGRFNTDDFERHRVTATVEVAF